MEWSEFVSALKPIDNFLSYNWDMNSFLFDDDDPYWSTIFINFYSCNNFDSIKSRFVFQKYFLNEIENFFRKTQRVKFFSEIFL